MAYVHATDGKMPWGSFDRRLRKRLKGYARCKDAQRTWPTVRSITSHERTGSLLTRRAAQGRVISHRSRATLELLPEHPAPFKEQDVRNAFNTLLRFRELQQRRAPSVNREISDHCNRRCFPGRNRPPRKAKSNIFPCSIGATLEQRPICHRVSRIWPLRRGCPPVRPDRDTQSEEISPVSGEARDCPDSPHRYAGAGWRGIERNLIQTQ